MSLGRGLRVPLLVGVRALLAGVAGDRISGWIKRNDVGRLQAAPREVVVPPAAGGARVSTAVSLQNDGRRPVRIQSVSTSCSCIALDDWRGRAIGPGQAVNFGISFTRPLKGHETRTISLQHDGVGSPLLINAVVFGTADLPYVNDLLPAPALVVRRDAVTRAGVVTLEPCGPRGLHPGGPRPTGVTSRPILPRRRRLGRS